MLTALVFLFAFVVLIALRPLHEHLANRPKSPVSCACDEARLSQVETDVASLTKKVNDAVDELKENVNSAAAGLASAAGGSSS